MNFAVGFSQVLRSSSSLTNTQNCMCLEIVTSQRVKSVVSVIHKHLLLILVGRAKTLCFDSSEPNQTVCFWVYLQEVSGVLQSGQETLAYTLLEECGHECPKTTSECGLSDWISVCPQWVFRRVHTCMIELSGSDRISQDAVRQPSCQYIPFWRPDRQSDIHTHFMQWLAACAEVIKEPETEFLLPAFFLDKTIPVNFHVNNQVQHGECPPGESVWKCVLLSPCLNNMSPPLYDVWLFTVPSLSRKKKKKL